MKDKNLGISVLPHKSFIFGFIFTSSTPDMEGKLLLRTEASKTLCWEIFFNINTSWFWAILSVIIIVSVKDKVRNYAEIYPKFSWKWVDIKIWLLVSEEHRQTSALWVYQTKY